MRTKEYCWWLTTIGEVQLYGVSHQMIELGQWLSLSGQP